MSQIRIVLLLLAFGISLAVLGGVAGLLGVLIRVALRTVI